MNILKSELYKLKKSMMFRVCAVICVAIAFFFAFALMNGVARGMEYVTLFEELSAVEFLAITFQMAWLPTAFALFISVFVSSEFHNGTIKNYVARGFNRLEIYLSKLAVCGIAIMVLFLVYIVSALIVGTFIWGFDPHGAAVFGNMSTLIFGMAFLMLAFTSIAVLVSMWLRSTGLSIAVNMCLITLLTTILMGMNYIIGDALNLEDFWIMQKIASLSTLTPEEGAISNSLTVGLCYLLGTSALGAMLFRKQDIK